MKHLLTLLILSILCLAFAQPAQPDLMHPGQFMVLPFEGTDAPLELLARYRPAGVILFPSNFDGDYTQMIATLRETDPELLIFTDQEGGPFMSYRTPEVVRFPSAMALAATGDLALAEAVGEAIGQQLCTLGVSVNLAPVMDVNVNPDNPIIGLRSFGSSPSQVASFALAYARGLQTAGVVPTVKHFPGHGDTVTDSHLGLPVVDKPRSALEATELAPFREAVATGILVVMSAHILYPALDPNLPATLSPAILTDLLRGELGFAGVVITDDMAMRAIRDHYGGAEAAERAVLAGADLVLAGRHPDEAEATFAALQQAIGAGRISSARYQETHARLATLRAARTPLCDTPDLGASAALAETVAAQSVTHLTGPLPLAAGETVVVAPNISARYGREPSLAELAPDYLPGSRGVSVSETPDEAEIAAAVAAAQGADTVVMGSYHWLGRLPEEQVRLYRALRALDTPLYVVALGNPGDFTYLTPAPDGYLATYGYRRVQLEAALRALAGEVLPTGQLPVAVGPFLVGAGSFRPVP